MQGIADYEHTLAQSYYDGLKHIPGVRVWGCDFSSRSRAPTVSITLDQQSAAAAATALAACGVCVWDGHFYAQRALQVLGLEARGGLLRTGVSMYNTPDDIQALLAGLELCRRGS
jgi:selenocysteine lyase/cysteine desulfurase